MEKTFKVTDHVFVPKHEIMDKEEAEKVLKSYNISKIQLPFISKEDPVVLEMQAKKGDIIKITRKSQTAGKAVYFRLVK